MTHLAALQDWDWIPVELQVPPRDALVRFKQETTGRQWTGRWSELRPQFNPELHPQFNVAYLWWKLTGIERMKGEM